jgi:hypothetical protein
MAGVESQAATERPIRTPSARVTAAANVLLVGFSFLFALGAAEIGFRVLSPQAIVPRYVETSPYGIRQNIPQVRGEMITPEYRHGFSTNSQGMRGVREYVVEKPPRGVSDPRPW